MENKKYYSCARNHYFFGKLMTVRDFENEQNYVNSKRRLGNRMLNGVGVVSGMNVILADNKTISIESGLALDYLGREIVLEESVVKRLSVIDGFENISENGDVYLCVEYKENLSETTFSVAGSAVNSEVPEEYNRVNEGYRLFLTSEKPNKNVLSLDNLIEDEFTVYNKFGVKITVRLSKYVNPHDTLKFTVVFEKLDVQSPVNYEFKVRGNLFKSIDGKDSLKIKFDETEISSYKKVEKDYYLVCDAVVDTITDLIIDAESFKIGIGKEFDKIEDNIKQSVTVTTDSVRDTIIENYYSKNFDEIIDVKDDQKIYLARMRVVSDKSTYFINEFKNNPFKQYVLSNDLISVLQRFNWVSDKKILNQNFKKDKQKNSNLQITDKKIEIQNNIITGVEKVEFGLYSKPGKVYYSNEFVHGIGYGDIGIITAVEDKETYTSDDPNSLIFGDTSVFKTEDISLLVPDVSIGTMVNTEKGTMRIGVKLLEKTSAEYVNVRWWAFKTNESKKEDIFTTSEVNVIVTPNTAQVKPFGQIRFKSSIEGTDGQDVTWSVVDSGSGTIDENGLYTAPAKEGVYEVRAQSVEFTDKYESAYIVVNPEE